MSSSLPRGVNRPHDPANQLEFVRGEGCYLWDKEGNRYLDFVSGYSSLVFGHSHPRLVAAAKDQLDTLVHLVGWNHPWRNQLAERLAQLAPTGKPAKTWISTTGSRAVEIAWKIALANRPGVLVSFDYAYHGRSIATSQITHTQKVPIQLPQRLDNPVVNDLSAARLTTASRGSSTGITLPILEYPQCDSCPLGLDRQSCHAECFDASEQWIREHQRQVSAIIVEPALGARGYYFASNAFFQRLRSLTKELGILLIDDEVQMGMGRLGSMFAAEVQGWQPDLVVMGKSLGGGLTNISAVIGPSELMDQLEPGLESETFAADPFACRIALEAIDLFEQDISPRLSELSESLQKGVDRLQQELSIRYPSSRLQVYSQGCAAVIQVLPEASLEPLALAMGGAANGFLIDQTKPEASAVSAGIAEIWTNRALQAGLLVHCSGKHRDRLVLIPPLVVSTEMNNEAINTLVSCYPSESEIIKSSPK